MRLLCFALGVMISMLVVPAISNAVNCSSVEYRSSSNYFPANMAGRTYVINNNEIKTASSVQSRSEGPYCTNTAGMPYSHDLGSELRVRTTEGFSTTCQPGYWAYGNRYYSVTSVGPCSNDPCGDGLLSPGEWAIDCGYTCGVGCEFNSPSSCNNGVADEGEYGIDCGGSCPAPCDKYCPSGYSYIESTGRCWAETNRDQFGNCPAGWSKDTYMSGPRAGEEVCTSNVAYTDSSPLHEPDSSQLPDVPSGWQSGNFNVTSATNTTRQDNGDGTSTVTRTSNQTNSDGSSSSTVQTDVVDNTTGVVISSNTTTQGTTPSDDNADNYDFGVPSFGDTSFDTNIEAPEKKSLINIIESFVGSHPMAAVLDTMVISETAGECELVVTDDVFFSSSGKFGQPLNISLCRWEDTLKALGAVLLVIVQAYGIMIIMGRK